MWKSSVFCNVDFESVICIRVFCKNPNWHWVDQGECRGVSAGKSKYCKTYWISKTRILQNSVFLQSWVRIAFPKSAKVLEKVYEITYCESIFLKSFKSTVKRTTFEKSNFSRFQQDKKIEKKYLKSEMWKSSVFLQCWFWVGHRNLIFKNLKSTGKTQWNFVLRDQKLEKASKLL